MFSMLLVNILSKAAANGNEDYYHVCVESNSKILPQFLDWRSKYAAREELRS